MKKWTKRMARDCCCWGVAGMQRWSCENQTRRQSGARAFSTRPGWARNEGSEAWRCDWACLLGPPAKRSSCLQVCPPFLQTNPVSATLQLDFHYSFLRLIRSRTPPFFQNLKTIQLWSRLDGPVRRQPSILALPFHLSHLLSRRCWWRHISSYGIQSHIVLGPRLGFLTLQVRIYNRGVSNCCWSSRLANFGIYCNWRSLQRLNFLYSIKTCSPMHFPIETIYIYIYGSSNFLTHCMPSSSHNPMTTILQAQQLGHWRYHPTMNKREIEKNKNKNIKTEHAFNSMSWTIKEIWASGIRRK